MEQIKAEIKQIRAGLTELDRRREKQLQELVKIEKELQRVKNDLDRDLAEVF